MAQATEAAARFETVADLLRRLGDVPAARVRLHPTPGTATGRDVLAIREREGRLFELIDETLVEKAMGFEESAIGLWIGTKLAGFVIQHRLGIVAGSDGMIWLLPGQVRMPDVAFYSWGRIPEGRFAAIAELTPDLAIEVISKSNTRREMQRKLREYFEAGVRLVWFVDPRKRAVRVHTSPKGSTLLDESQSLDGGEVLPGFVLPLAELFACLDRPAGA